MTPVSLAVFLASVYCSNQLPCIIEPINAQDHSWYVDIEQYDDGAIAMLYCELNATNVEYSCLGTYDE